jgi:hypothetical protein
LIFNIRRATINYDILLNNLKLGDSYTVSDGIAEPYTVTRPPNKYMLAAAKVIEQLVTQLQHQQNVLMQVQASRDEIANQLTLFQTKAQQNGTTEV